MIDLTDILSVVPAVKTPTLPEKQGGGKAVSRQTAYSKAASHFYEAFEVILEMMHHGKQDSVRLGAANKIIDKVLPDLKATELDGDLRVQLQNVIRLPAKRPLDTPPKTN